MTNEELLNDLLQNLEKEHTYNAEMSIREEQKNLYYNGKTSAIRDAMDIIKAAKKILKHKELGGQL